MKSAARDLAIIAAEISSELKRGSACIIKTGELLAEAKRQVKHGSWGKWINDNFAMSESTAQRYLQVRKFLKTRTVRDLEIASHLVRGCFTISRRNGANRFIPPTQSMPFSREPIKAGWI